MIPKSPINVLHYVGADAYNGINGSFGSAVQVRTTSY